MYAPINKYIILFVYKVLLLFLKPTFLGDVPMKPNFTFSNWQFLTKLPRIPDLKSFWFVLTTLVLGLAATQNSAAQTCCPEFRLKDAIEVCPSEGACMKHQGAPGGPAAPMLVACKESTHVYTIYPNDPIYTYTWTIVGGTAATPTGNPKGITWGTGSSGFIKVVITGLNGCVDSLLYEVCLLDKPLANFSLQPDTVCVNTPVYFTNLSTGGAVSFWEFGDGNTSDDFNAVHSYAAPGVYTVLLTVTDQGGGNSTQGDTRGACGCSDTISKQVVVLSGQGPKIETDCCHGTACPDQIQKFCTPDTCTTYVWSVTGGTIISGQGTQCIQVMWDQINSIPTTVSLETPGCGPSPCPAKTTLQVPVLYPNMPISGPNVLCVGASGNFSLPHLPGTYYTWTVSGGLYTLSDYDQNVSNINVTFNSPGTFTIQCNYNNPLSGCSGSSTHIVSVRPPFQITFGRDLVCEGDTELYFATNLATWSATPAGATVPGGALNPCPVTWNTPGTYVLMAVTTTPGVYCNDTTYKVVEVVAKPVLSAITGPAIACPNKNFTFSVTSNVSGSPFIWSVSPGTGIVHSTLNEDGDEAIIQLTGAGPWTVNVFQQIELSPGQFCQSLTQSLNVNSFPLPVITGNTTVCVDAIETYSTPLPIPPGGYQWSISPSNRGTVLTGQGTDQVTIRWHGTPTTANVIVTSCSGTDILPVTIINPPFVSPVTANGPTGYCLPAVPNNLLLSVTSGYPSYQWYQNGILIPGANSSSYLITTLPATPATYVFSVVVSTGFCDVTKSILIVVGNCTPGVPFPPPPPCSLDFTINPNPACVNQPVTFTAQPSFGGFEYAWDFGDAATSFTQITEHAYNAPGIYNVTLVGTFPNLCTLTVVKQVTVNPLPNCVITAADTIFCPGDSVLMTACPGMMAYQWYRDDVLIPGATNQTYYVTQHGEYHVVATNNFGCSDKSNAKYIYMHGLPKAKIKAQRTHCAFPGSLVQLNLSAHYNANYSYYWSDIPLLANFSVNNSNLAVNTTADFFLPLTLPYQHQFVLAVTDTTTGCMNYDTICITFYETPDLSFAWQSACEGNPLTFVPVPNDPTKYHYVWSNGAKTPIITVSAAGSYSLTITDKATGCSNTAMAGMIFPKPDLSLFPLGCKTIQCEDTLNIYIPLPLNSLSWNNNYPVFYPVIEWYNQNDSLVGTGQSFPFVSGMAAYHELYVVVQNVYGCVDTTGVFCLTVECLNLGDLDFGDAPQCPTGGPGYNTLLIHNGARHQIVPGVYLGSLVDPEPDGQPNFNADGDDTDALYPSLGDDEDGVILPGFISPGQTVVAIVNASVAGYLDLWIDFNINCSWADPGDHVLSTYPVNQGVNDIVFEVPCDVSFGKTYARFRFRTDNLPISYDGFWPNGEVEDYMLFIEGEPCALLDFGDAPEIPRLGLYYPTTLINNGARHNIVPGVFLGSLIDAEPDGQPSLNADGDDFNNFDDEDGVTFTSLLVQGQLATVDVVASTTGFLDAWIDFDQDGTWINAIEHIFASLPLSPGLNSLSFMVPATAQAGNTYARFRFRTNSAPISYDGLVSDGEVEDYLVHIDEYQTGDLFDFGDAPEESLAYLAPPTIGNFPTCMNTGGAGSYIQHLNNPGIFFGPLVDYETDGNAGFCPLFNPNAYNQDECFADGDAGLMYPVPYTISGAVGSETIVPCIQEPSFAWYTCTFANWGSDLDIFVNNTNSFNLPAYVNVMIDWNQDGVWGGSSMCFTGAPAPEHVLANFMIPAGYVGPLSALTTPPPGFLVGPNPGYVWARFSITESPVAAGWDGSGVFDFGESEDYLFKVIEEVMPELYDFGDAPEFALAYPPSTTGRFPTCVNVGTANSFIRHSGNKEAFFGPSVDYEAEGNAGFCPTFNPNTYNMDECWMDGDAGLVMPRAYTITGSVGSETIVPCADGPNPLWRTCRMAQWGKNIDIRVTNNLPGQAPAYVNLIIDWNQNGMWGGNSLCFNQVNVPEHVLINFVVPPGFNGLLSSLLPPDFRVGPTSGYVWARFSITETPVAAGWDGSGIFGFGESEDYLFRISQTIIPDIIHLHDIFIPHGLDTCIAATNTIIVGGSGSFVVESGGSVRLEAGESVRMLEGTRVFPGGYLLARIVTDDMFCLNHRSVIATADSGSNQEINPALPAEDGTFKVFPNPTTGKFTLELSKVDAEPRLVVVEVYSMMGELLLNMQLPESKAFQLDLGNQKSGIYLIRVLRGNESGIERIIKQ